MGALCKITLSECPSDRGMENLPSCGECGSNEHVGVYEEEEEEFSGPPYETWWCSTCEHEIDCYGDRLSDDVVWTFCPSCGKDIHPKHSNEDGLFRCNEDGCPDGLFRHASNAEYHIDHGRRVAIAEHSDWWDGRYADEKITESQEAQALRYVDHPDYEMNET